MKKKTYLVALALFLTLGLAACNSSDDTDTNTDTDSTVETEAATDDVEETDTDASDAEATDTDVADGPGHATSGPGIADGERLTAVLSADSPERAWVAGLVANIEMEGPLYIDGEVERHSANQWSGTYARKIGFYQRETINGIDRIPVGALSLTVNEGIVVNSPQTFFIADGPFEGEIFGNVYVNIPYFRLTGVRVHGDVIFATQEYMDTAVWQAWDEAAAEIIEGEDADYETDFVLYQSNSGFETNAPLSSSDAAANVSNAEPANLVTGEVRVAE